MEIEPSATALEQMGQIRMKKGDAKEAVSLFERAITVPKTDKIEEIIWRARAASRPRRRARSGR